MGVAGGLKPNCQGFGPVLAEAMLPKLRNKDKNNKNCFKSLKSQLPKYISSFPIKKNEISKAIIADKWNLKKIVKIVHPEVRFRMNNFIKKNKSKKFVILDIPLLIENKLNKKNDILIFVDAKKKEINKRLKKRHGVVVKILKKFQLPVEFKKQKSDFIIKNNFRNNFTEKNVKMVLEKILLNA